MSYITRERVSVSAPVNIAFVKYWGKQDEFNIHPFNNSISLTLNQNSLKTITTISTDAHLKETSFSLNGIQTDLPGRHKDVIILCQIKARILGAYPVHRFLHIETTNNFPTGAGLASSASGLAALTYALVKLYRLDEFGVEFTGLARRGSGSACRSMFGGFVHWVKNDAEVPTLGDVNAAKQSVCTSVAKQIYPESYWPDLRVLICITSSRPKLIGSRSSMQNTMATSRLFQLSRKEAAGSHENRILAALANRDFAQLAEVAMREANQLHAVCLDSWPPCFYLTEASTAIISWVLAVNRTFKRTLVGYTFDAGSNAFLLTTVDDLALVCTLLNACFGVHMKNDGVESLEHQMNQISQSSFLCPEDVVVDSKKLKFSLLNSYAPPDELVNSTRLIEQFSVEYRGAIEYVIVAKPGSGPTLIDLQP